jgi:hypothetical protein
MPQPFTIEPSAWYDSHVVLAIFGIGPETLARARREGVLRFSRRGRKTLYKGEWLQEWLCAENQREAALA